MEKSTLESGKQLDPPAREGFDFISTLENHGREIVRIAAAVTVIVIAIVSAYYFWFQHTLKVVSIEFRPSFSGAAQGRYPNGLSFAPSDVTAPSVVDQVFDSNGIEQYCSRESFKSGFVVEQYSMHYALLDAEFEQRLADTRLTALDRERIQDEYQARRDALPLQYRLAFVSPRDCRHLPAALVSKSLTDVLAVWAHQSEFRRGVLMLQVQVLTPSILDVGLTDPGSRLIRADLIRKALTRLIANVRAVEERPGASLVRIGPEKVTFAEIRTKLEDLIESRLEPLVIIAGRGLGAESVGWVQEALSSSRREQDVAEGKARAYLTGLREYSGIAQQPTTQLESSGRPPSSDLQSLAPQIDRTFIDRILEMSQANTEFRQDLTRGMVEAEVEAVEGRTNVQYYEHLAASLRGAPGAGLTGAEVEDRLENIVNEGKQLAKTFNDLYFEWSRISLRPVAELYQVQQPPASSVSRSLSFRMLVLVIVGTALVSLLLAFVIFLMADQVRSRHRVSRVVG